MSQPPLREFLQSLYQEILRHSEMAEMGFGNEDADDDLTNSVAYLLQQKGIPVEMILYEVDLINLVFATDMAMYVRALRLDGDVFDLMGNGGQENIILGAMERHHDEQWKEFQWRKTHIDEPSPLPQPTQVWDQYLDERLSAYLQHQHIQEATPMAKSSKGYPRL